MSSIIAHAEVSSAIPGDNPFAQRFDLIVKLQDESLQLGNLAWMRRGSQSTVTEMICCPVLRAVISRSSVFRT